MQNKKIVMEKTISKILEFELYSTRRYNTQVLLNLLKTKPLSTSKQKVQFKFKMVMQPKIINFLKYL